MGQTGDAWGREGEVLGAGLARTPTGVGQTGDVHGGVRGRTWVPMGAWSSLDIYGGGADWGRPRGREGEVLGAHGGMV